MCNSAFSSQNDSATDDDEEEEHQSYVKYSGVNRPKIFKIEGTLNTIFERRVKNCQPSGQESLSLLYFHTVVPLFLFDLNRIDGP